MNSDKVTKAVLFSVSILILLLAAGMLYSLVGGSLPSFKAFGLQFIISGEWDPTYGREKYGALPFIVGTLITSFAALLISLPLSFSASLFLGEYFRGTRVA
nr:phosphate ABC transporter permease subunit PstC [Sunxiuqinia sp.]